MLDFSLISIWRAKRSCNQYINPHSHNYHELVYYPLGNGETKISGQAYTFTGSSFALIPPGTCHDEYHHTDSEVVCLEFSTSLNLPQGFYQDPSLQIYKILKDILHEVKEQDLGYKDMIALKLGTLWLHISRKTGKANTEKNFEYIINYLKENYHEKIVFSYCAKQLNISYDYFQHRFKQITGKSPRQFLLQQRLNAAEKLLRTGGLSCTEIAYRCGFSTSAQFSSLFKRQYGLPPLQYQRQQTIPYK